MFFKKDEKVFSLSGTADTVLMYDISRLWSEFFSYLLVAGFYREGEPTGEGSVHLVMSPIGNPRFALMPAAYAGNLGYLLAKGLHKRFQGLLNHNDLTPKERNLLGDLNGLFDDAKPSFYQLSAKDIYAVAKERNFSENDLVIAHYVAQTFGQKDFLSEATLPNLYLSMFGNIHLSREEEVVVKAPELIYGSKTEGESTVTALWSFLSTQIDSLAEYDYPGNRLVDKLSNYMFVANDGGDQKSISAPRRAASLYMTAMTNIDTNSGGSLSSRFYQMFLYGDMGNISIARYGVFSTLLDLMVKKMGQTRRDHLFPFGSIYNKFQDSSRIYGKEPRRSYLLDYALEALDENPETTDDSEKPEKPIVDGSDGDLPSTTQTPDAPEDPVEADPSVEDGGFDPSSPTPPKVGPVMGEEENTIGLISFDKTGEGVDEDLYRSAVVALNDRLKSDDSIPVAAEVKDALNFWVNGYLYRTAISATKEQIASLGLKSYLKNVSN